MSVPFAPSSASLADPSGSSAIVAAVGWIEGTLLGTVATVVAVIAVASIGFMMLGGRVRIRHGLTVILGSFILFGASTIAAGLRSSLPEGDQDIGAFVPEPPPVAATPPPPPPANNDPYAGASVARP